MRFLCRRIASDVTHPVTVRVDLHGRRRGITWHGRPRWYRRSVQGRVQRRVPSPRTLGHRQLHRPIIDPPRGNLVGPGGRLAGIVSVSLISRDGVATTWRRAQVRSRTEPGMLAIPFRRWPLGSQGYTVLTGSRLEGGGRGWLCRRRAST